MYLRSRLALTFGISSLLTVLLASYFFSRAARQIVQEQYEDSLRDMATLLLPDIQATIMKEPGEVDSQLDRLAQGLETRLTVIDSAGDVLGDSQRSGADLRAMENHAGRPEFARALAGDVGTDTRTSATLGVAFLYLAMPVRSEGHVVGALRVATPLVKLREFEAVKMRFVAAGAAAVLAASFLVAAFLGAWFTRPMRKLQALADRIADGDLTPPSDHGDRPLERGELADLAFTMQKIASSLDATVRQLKADQAIQSAIVSTLQDGILAIDRRGRIVLANRAASELLAVETDLLGHDVFDLWRQPEATALLTELIAGRGGEAHIRVDGPRAKTLRLSAAPVSTIGSSMTGLVLLNDITVTVATQKVRRDFFNNASHELRTPLTSIIGYLEALEDQLPGDSPLRTQFLAVLIRQADRMRRIVDDLLTLAQVESEEWPLQIEDYDLMSQVKHLIEAFGPAARQNSQTLVSTGPDRVMVSADREKIHIVLSNLIDNAVKYAGQGARIEVALAVENDRARVTVSDNGPGIPLDQAERVFERFYRLDKSRSRAMGGTGLGLAIVRHILVAHKELIKVETDLGSGAKFVFLLPRPATTDSATAS